MNAEDLAVVERGLAPDDDVKRCVDVLLECWQAMSREERLAWAGELPGRPPVGYVRKASGMTRDPVRASSVTALFQQVGSSGSTDNALETAQRDGLTVPTGDAAVRMMGPDHLGRMLANEFYVGVVAFRRRAYVGKHPRLVDRSTFGAVQRALRASDDAPTDEVSDVLQCDMCGRSMALRRARTYDDRTVDYLCCLGRHAVGIDCPASAVEVSAVRTAIAELLDSIRIHPDRLGRVLEQLRTRSTGTHEVPRDAGADEDALDPSLDDAVRHVADLLDHAAELYVLMSAPQRERIDRTVFHEVRVDLDGVASVEMTTMFAAVLALARAVEEQTPALEAKAAADVDAVAKHAPRVDDTTGRAGSGRSSALQRAPRATRSWNWITSHTAPTTLVILAVWWLFVREISETDFDDLGVIGTLPVIAFVAPLAVIGLLTRAVAEGARDRVKLFHVGVLTVMLYGVGAVVGNILQARIVFRHEGIADTIFRTGSVDPGIDAYFNWPGFFSFLALARHMVGIEGFGPLALWAPVLFNITYVLVTVVIARTIGFRERVVWGAAVVFLLGNWVGQDYLSPQASAFLVYLVVIAALLIRLEGDDSVTRRERVTVIGLVIVLFAAIVPSHQLTPIVTVMTVTALVAVRATRARGLPLVMGAVLLSWLVFMSATYLQGNLQKMLDLVGDLEAAGSSNVTQRLGGSPGHQQVVRLRLLYTGIIGLVAFVGWLLSIKRRRFHWSLTVAVGTPALMMILQPYGGEMILRVFFFALPFLSMYAASAMLGGDPGRMRRTRLAALVIAVGVALPTFFVARYGNSRLDIFTEDEKRAIEILYHEAEPGALMLAMVDNLPWKHRQYEVHDYETVDRQVVVTIDPQVISAATVALMYSDRTRPAYLILSNSQQTYIELLGGLPPDAIDTTEAAIRSDPEIVNIVDRPSVRIYHLAAEEER